MPIDEINYFCLYADRRHLLVDLVWPYASYNINDSYEEYRKKSSQYDMYLCLIQTGCLDAPLP